MIEVPSKLACPVHSPSCSACAPRCGSCGDLFGWFEWFWYVSVVWRDLLIDSNSRRRRSPAHQRASPRHLDRHVTGILAMLSLKPTISADLATWLDFSTCGVRRRVTYLIGRLARPPLVKVSRPFVDRGLYTSAQPRCKMGERVDVVIWRWDAQLVACGLSLGVGLDEIFISQAYSACPTLSNDLHR